MYHFHAGIISRSSGGSASAHAAYISASRIHDDRTGETWDYTKKKGEILCSFILAPEGSPSWVYDGETLWNTVEQFEDSLADQRYKGNKDSVKNARSLEGKDKFLNTAKTQYTSDIALPLEITDPKQLRELSEKIIQECYVNKGLIVQAAIHLKKGNPHLHIAATPRAIHKDSQTFSEQKTRINKNVLTEMRRQVAEIGNAFAAAHGYSYKWDHRSYKDQGIEVVPTRKRGWAAERLEKMGGVSRIFQENSELRQQNIELLLEKPENLIRLVAGRKAVFTRQDIEEEILRRVGGDSVLYGALKDKVSGVKIASSAVLSKVVNDPVSMKSPAQTPFSSVQRNTALYDSAEVLKSVSSWTAQVMSREETVEAGENIRGEKVYTSQEYHTLEKEAVGYIAQLKAGSVDVISASVRETALAKVEKTQGFAFSAEQKAAFDHLMSSRPIEVLTGRAGTGKTTVLKPVVEAYRQCGYTVIGTSFQGKVKDMLSRELGIQSYTLDQLRYHWREYEGWKTALEEGTLRGRALVKARQKFEKESAYKLTDKHVVIVDEGNMVGGGLWRDLLKEVASSGAILKVVGDNQQIKTLYGGDISRLIEEQCGAVSLRQVHRQKETWMQEASALLNDHRVEQGLRKYQEKGHLTFHDSAEGACFGLVMDMMQGFEEDRRQGGYSSRVALAYRNEDVRELNEALHIRLQDRGMLGQEFEIRMKDSDSATLNAAGEKTVRMSLGERIVFTRNDSPERQVKTLQEKGSLAKGVSNGTIGTLEAYDEKKGTMKVRLEDGRLVGFDSQSYSSVSYGYALTVNKSEGETYAHTHVLFDPLMDANSLLISLTRHKQDCRIRSHAVDLKDMVQAAGRSSYRGVLSDYAIEAADKPLFDLVQRYALKVKEAGSVAEQIAAGREEQERMPSLLPPVPVSAALANAASSVAVASGLAGSVSAHSVISPAVAVDSETSSPSDALYSPWEKVVQERESLAKKVLSAWEGVVPWLNAAGLTRTSVEIHAGLRERLLSDAEQVALKKVDVYRQVAFETKQAWAEIKVACPVKVLAFQHSGWARFEVLRERRGNLAYEMAAHPSLYRSLFSVRTSGEEGEKLYTTLGGSVYKERPSSFKTMLKHAEDSLSRQKDTAYISLLSPSDRQSYGEVLRLRDLMRSASGLYKGWQEAQQGGVHPSVAEGALRRLQEVRRERDLQAYRIMDSAKDSTPFLEKLGVDAVSVLKHGAAGEVRLLCLKREYSRSIEDRIAASSRLLAFVEKGAGQTALSSEQKGWLMVMKEHGATLDHLRFESGYGKYLQEGHVPVYKDGKELSSAWVDIEAYRRTHREGAKRWEVVKTWATAHVQGIQDAQVNTLNLLDTGQVLLREQMEETAMTRLQARAVNPRVLASVSSEIRQVVNGVVSFSDLGEEIKARQGELTHLQSHLRRGRSGYLSLYADFHQKSSGYESLRQKKLGQAWQVMEKSGNVIEGMFGQGHVLDAARLHKEAEEYATQQKVRALKSSGAGEIKSSLGHALWQQHHAESQEGKSLVRSAVVKEGVTFDRLCLYATVHEHVRAGGFSEEPASLYKKVETYLEAKEMFSSLWKQRMAGVDDQLSEIREAYGQKREEVICLLEGKNMRGYIPSSVDRLVDGLVPDESGNVQDSAREKITVFIKDKGLAFSDAEKERLSTFVSDVYSLKEAVHEQRLELMGKPDNGLMSVIIARNEAAKELLSTSLEETLRSSREKILQSVVNYGERSLRASSLMKAGSNRKQSRQTSEHDKLPSLSVSASLSPAEIKQTWQEEDIPDKEREEVLRARREEGEARGTTSEKASVVRLSPVSKDPHYSLEEVRRSLTPYGVESICHALLGESGRNSSKRQLRYGKSGSLAISLSDSSLGLWKDHSRDEGGDIFRLVMRERGGDFKEALSWVAEALRVTPEKKASQAYVSSSSDQEDEARRMQKVQKLLEASRPVQGTVAERYLREHRGIREELSSDVRFIPSVWNSRAKASYPALVSLARDSYGTVTALQVVYLDQETGNKADVELKKQSFGMVKGSYVQIQKGQGSVLIAEGVETALSVREAGVKGDIYAALGISNFRNAGSVIQDKTRPIVICADQDGEGSPAHKAVEKAVDVLGEEGFSVSVIRPSAEYGKEDFNDVLKREGLAGIRAYFEEYVNTPDGQQEAQAVSDRSEDTGKAVKDVLNVTGHTQEQENVKEPVASLQKNDSISHGQLTQKDDSVIQNQEAASQSAPDAAQYQLSQSADDSSSPQKKISVETGSVSSPSQQELQKDFEKIKEFIRQKGRNTDIFENYFNHDPQGAINHQKELRKDDEKFRQIFSPSSSQSVQTNIRNQDDNSSSVSSVRKRDSISEPAKTHSLIESIRRYEHVCYDQILYSQDYDKAKHELNKLYKQAHANPDAMKEIAQTDQEMQKRINKHIEKEKATEKSYDLEM